MRRALPLRDLAAFDVEVDLKVARWLGLDIDIRDASFAWRADALGLRVPMSATIAGAPFTGSLELDTSAPMPTLAVQLGANDAVFGDLAQGLGLAGGVEGTVGRLGLRMDGRGETLASLARDLELSLSLAAARLSFGGAAGAGRIAVSLDKLDLAARRGDRLRGHAHGMLLGRARQTAVPRRHPARHAARTRVAARTGSGAGAGHAEGRRHPRPGGVDPRHRVALRLSSQARRRSGALAGRFAAGEPAGGPARPGAPVGPGLDARRDDARTRPQPADVRCPEHARRGPLPHRGVCTQPTDRYAGAVDAA